MKRILHIVGAMAPGGFENFIMNVYRSVDRSRVQFDFIVCAKKENAYDEEIESMGGRLYYVTRKSENPVKNFLEIRRVVKRGGYRIVCRHTDNAYAALDLLAARLGGAKKAILHSHSTTTGAKGAHKLCRLLLAAVPTERFACSAAAGNWMFGKRPFRFVPNAVEVERYGFRREERERKREELGLAGRHVYGHVGNFVYAKNHPFLLDILAGIVRQDEKAVCLMAGGGEGRAAAEEKVRALELADRIRFLGVRKDVPALLQALDVFVFPSIYEGLPVSVIEAQAAGLPCLISDTVTEDVVLTDSVKRMSLEQPADFWAQEAVRLAEAEDIKTDTGRAEASAANRQAIRAAGYEVKDLAAFYENL